MNKGIWSANNLVKLQLDPNYVDGNFRDVTRLVFLKKKIRFTIANFGLISYEQAWTSLKFIIPEA